MNLLRLISFYFRRITVFGGVPRASGWSKLRNDFLQGKVCAICGGSKLLNAHHILPFHLHPELELDKNNLIPLCEATRWNCHLLFGHFNNFALRYNPNIIEEAKTWQEKLTKHIAV